MGLTHMHKIDVNSETWKAVITFAEKEKAKAVDSLIEDDQSERQRGVIGCLEALENLPSPAEKPIENVDYQ